MKQKVIKPALKQHLEGCQFHNNVQVQMAVCEWLLMQETNFYHIRTVKVMSK
jgi:hypothetical protein